MKYKIGDRIKITKNKECPEYIGQILTVTDIGVLCYRLNEKQWSYRWVDKNSVLYKAKSKNLPLWF